MSNSNSYLTSIYNSFPSGEIEEARCRSAFAIRRQDKDENASAGVAVEGRSSSSLGLSRHMKQTDETLPKQISSSSTAMDNVYNPITSTFTSVPSSLPPNVSTDIRNILQQWLHKDLISVCNADAVNAEILTSCICDNRTARRSYASLARYLHGFQSLEDTISTIQNTISSLGTIGDTGNIRPLPDESEMAEERNESRASSQFSGFSESTARQSMRLAQLFSELQHRGIPVVGRQQLLDAGVVTPEEVEILDSLVQTAHPDIVDAYEQSLVDENPHALALRLVAIAKHHTKNASTSHVRRIESPAIQFRPRAPTPNRTKAVELLDEVASDDVFISSEIAILRQLVASDDTPTLRLLEDAAKSWDTIAVNSEARAALYEQLRDCIEMRTESIEMSQGLGAIKSIPAIQQFLSRNVTLSPAQEKKLLQMIEPIADIVEDVFDEVNGLTAQRILYALCDYMRQEEAPTMQELLKCVSDLVEPGVSDTTNDSVEAENEIEALSPRSAATSMSEIFAQVLSDMRAAGQVSGSDATTLRHLWAAQDIMVHAAWQVFIQTRDAEELQDTLLRVLAREKTAMAESHEHSLTVVEGLRALKCLTDEESMILCGIVRRSKAHQDAAASSPVAAENGSTPKAMRSNTTARKRRTSSSTSIRSEWSVTSKRVVNVVSAAIEAYNLDRDVEQLVSTLKAAAATYKRDRSLPKTTLNQSISTHGANHRIENVSDQVYDQNSTDQESNNKQSYDQNSDDAQTREQQLNGKQQADNKPIHGEQPNAELELAHKRVYDRQPIDNQMNAEEQVNDGLSTQTNGIANGNSMASTYEESVVTDIHHVSDQNQQSNIPQKSSIQSMSNMTKHSNGHHGQFTSSNGNNQNSSSVDSVIQERLHILSQLLQIGYCNESDVSALTRLINARDIRTSAAFEAHEALLSTSNTSEQEIDLLLEELAHTLRTILALDKDSPSLEEEEMSQPSARSDRSGPLSKLEQFLYEVGASLEVELPHGILPTWLTQHESEQLLAQSHSKQFQEMARAALSVYSRDNSGIELRDTLRRLAALYKA